jgi:hypothetical protein
MRQVYSDRSQLLTEEANRRLSGLLDVENAQSGMCTVAWIKTCVTEMVLTRRAEQLGLEVVPISSYVRKYEQKRALMLGFAGCNASEIRSLSQLLPNNGTLRMVYLSATNSRVRTASSAAKTAGILRQQRCDATLSGQVHPLKVVAAKPKLLILNLAMHN